MTRIIQITDLHLLADAGAIHYGVDTAESLSRVIDSVNQLTPRADAILATGDLAEDGKPETYRRLKTLLKSVTCPVYFVPGNHDDVDVMNEWLNDEGLSTAGSAEVGQWAVVLLNSQVPGQSHGFIAESEISRLKNAIENFDHQPVLIALHHSPDNSCNSSGCHLHNADELRALVSKYANVKLIIAGHTHNAVESSVGGWKEMTTPSTFAHVTHETTDQSNPSDGFWSCHQLDASRQGYRVLDLTDDGGIESEVHWISSLPQEFSTKS